MLENEDDSFHRVRYTLKKKKWSTKNQIMITKIKKEMLERYIPLVMKMDSDKSKVAHSEWQAVT